MNIAAKHDWEYNVYLHYIISCVLTHFESSDVWQRLCPRAFLYIFLTFFYRVKLVLKVTQDRRDPQGQRSDSWFWHQNIENFIILIQKTRFSMSFSSIMEFKYETSNNNILTYSVFVYSSSVLHSFILFDSILPWSIFFGFDHMLNLTIASDHYLIISSVIRMIS